MVGRLMKATFLIPVALFLVGCVTNDFKVVDALHTGMSHNEVQTTIASYGFERREYLIRPAEGWQTIETLMALPKRAKAVEDQLGVVVASAEYYPVHHGMLGFGELFLFYDAGGKLIHFYRHQIN